MRIVFRFIVAACVLFGGSLGSRASRLDPGGGSGASLIEGHDVGPALVSHLRGEVGDAVGRDESSDRFKREKPAKGGTQGQLKCKAVTPDSSIDQILNCGGNILTSSSSEFSIDLSSISQKDIGKLFPDKLMKLNFSLIHSQLENVTFRMQPELTPLTAVVRENDLLSELAFVLPEADEMLYLDIRGNRKLSPDSLKNITIFGNSSKHISVTYLQGYGECIVPSTVVSFASLEGCVYTTTGITIKDNTDTSTTFPSGLTEIRGCLQIENTQLTSIDFAMNLNVTNCDDKNKISGNSQLCLHPKEKVDLANYLGKTEFTNNQDCAGECNPSWFLENKDTGCAIIKGDLTLTKMDQKENFTAFKNVEEVHGRLVITNTELERIDFFPKLRNIAPDDKSSAAIHIQYNSKLSNISFPSLENIKVAENQKYIYVAENGDYDMPQDQRDLWEDKFPGSSSSIKSPHQGNVDFEVPAYNRTGVKGSKKDKGRNGKNDGSEEDEGLSGGAIAGIVVVVLVVLLLGGAVAGVVIYFRCFRKKEVEYIGYFLPTLSGTTEKFFFVTDKKLLQRAADKVKDNRDVVKKEREERKALMAQGDEKEDVQQVEKENPKEIKVHSEDLKETVAMENLMKKEEEVMKKVEEGMKKDEGATKKDETKIENDPELRIVPVVRRRPAMFLYHRDPNQTDEEHQRKYQALLKAYYKKIADNIAKEKKQFEANKQAAIKELAERRADMKAAAEKKEAERQAAGKETVPEKLKGKEKSKDAEKPKEKEESKDAEKPKEKEESKDAEKPKEVEESKDAEKPKEKEQSKKPVNGEREAPAPLTEEELLKDFHQRIRTKIIKEDVDDCKQIISTVWRFQYECKSPSYACNPGKTFAQKMIFDNKMIDAEKKVAIFPFQEKFYKEIERRNLKVPDRMVEVGDIVAPKVFRKADKRRKRVMKAVIDHFNLDVSLPFTSRKEAEHWKLHPLYKCSCDFTKEFDGREPDTNIYGLRWEDEFNKPKDWYDKRYVTGRKPKVKTSWKEAVKTPVVYEQTFAYTALRMTSPAQNRFDDCVSTSGSVNFNLLVDKLPNCQAGSTNVAGHPADVDYSVYMFEAPNYNMRVFHTKIPVYEDDEKLPQYANDKALAASYLKASFQVPIGKCIQIDEEHLIRLCDLVLQSCGTEPIVKMKLPVRIFGEVRGKVCDLIKLLSVPQEQACGYLFLGHYLGQMNTNIGTLVLLLAMKVYFGKGCVLLRGMTEWVEVNKQLTFTAEIEEMFPMRKVEILDKINKVFAMLPLACRVGKKIFCTSAGVAPDMKYLNQVELPIEYLFPDTLPCNLMFATPNYTVSGFFDNMELGSGYFFGEEEFYKAAEQLQFDVMFTSKVLPTGWGQFGEEKRLYSLCSAMNAHENISTPVAALADIDEKGVIHMRVVTQSDADELFLNPIDDPISMSTSMATTKLSLKSESKSVMKSAVKPVSEVKQPESKSKQSDVQPKSGALPRTSKSGQQPKSNSGALPRTSKSGQQPKSNSGAQPRASKSGQQPKSKSGPAPQSKSGPPTAPAPPSKSGPSQSGTSSNVKQT